MPNIFQKIWDFYTVEEPIENQPKPKQDKKNSKKSSIRLSVVIKLAYRSLLAHKLRTIVTVVGVTVGVAAIIFLVSLGYGLEQLVTRQVADFEAFTIIDVPAANIKTIRIDEDVMNKIKNLGNIKTVAPVTNLAGRIRKADGLSTAETIIVAANSDYWQLAGTKVIKGRLPSEKSEVVLNNMVLSMIGENSESVIGKTINLDVIIPPENRTKQEDGLKVENNVPFKVVGVSDEIKNPLVYISLQTIQKLDATKFTSLKVKVLNRTDVPRIRKQIENIGFSTEYVGDTVDQISQFFSLFRLVLAAFGSIALAVAALGTFNTLTVSLLERTREVGLLKALGMRNKDVYKLFLAESLIIGGLGGILGLFLGIFGGQLVNFVLYILAARAGVEKIGIFVTPMAFAFAVAAFALVVGFVTGWYPSRRAMKIDPLDALRYE